MTAPKFLGLDGAWLSRWFVLTVPLFIYFTTTKAGSFCPSCNLETGGNEVHTAESLLGLLLVLGSNLKCLLLHLKSRVGLVGNEQLLRISAWSRW
jgi:hypothetical protein